MHHTRLTTKTNDIRVGSYAIFLYDFPLQLPLSPAELLYFSLGIIEQCYTEQKANLFAAAGVGNKGTVRVLATTLSVGRGLDASSAISSGLAVAVPEKGPAVRVDSGHLGVGWGGASVGGASAIGSTVGFIVLVIGLEDGKGLCLRCPSVVRTLGGLDGLGHLCGGAVEGRWTLALGVGGGGVQGRRGGGDGQGQIEDGGDAGLHD